MTKINFENKETLNPSPLPEKNKVTADNMNELKAGVNELEQEKEEVSNKVQNLSNPSPTTYPSTQAVVDYVNQAAPTDYYGIAWDDEYASTSMIRIGSEDMHRDLPIQSLMRRVLLLDDGSVNYYLDKDDSTLKEDGVTPADLTGADGMVMVEIPPHYVLFQQDDNIKKFMASLTALPGFTFVPRMYVSAYEATVERSTSKLASVVNLDPDFRGGNDNPVGDGTNASLLGMPASLLSRIDFRDYARNRGSHNWNCMLHTVRKAIFWLYMLEYADKNSQKAFDPTLTSNGMRQGGLGAGVTNVVDSHWTAFNGRYGFVPCGTTNSLGNNTGVVSYQPTGFTNNITVEVPSYRGIENVFGHLWEWTDGINVRVESAAAGGTSKVFVADSLTMSDTDYVGYSEVGETLRVNSYIKDLIFTDGEIMAKSTGGAATTYWCDQAYNTVPSGNNIELRGVLSSGAANTGAYAGLACSNTNHVPSNTSTNVGSRLCFVQ